MLSELEIKLNAWMGKSKFASHFKNSPAIFKIKKG